MRTTVDATWTVRLATLDDVPTIAHQRVSMFRDMGVGDDETLARMDRDFRVWVAEKIAAALYVGWLAVVSDEVVGDRVVGGLGLWLHEWFPSPYDMRPLRGYILNVHTEREFRRRGIARGLVAAALDHCRAQGIAIVSLHTSDAGRSTYAAMGFESTNEMRIHLHPRREHDIAHVRPTPAPQERDDGPRGPAGGVSRRIVQP